MGDTAFTGFPLFTFSPAVSQDWRCGHLFTRQFSGIGGEAARAVTPDGWSVTVTRWVVGAAKTKNSFDRPHRSADGGFSFRGWVHRRKHEDRWRTMYNLSIAPPCPHAVPTFSPVSTRLFAGGRGTGIDAAIAVHRLLGEFHRLLAGRS
jgi:hypothetical protein